MPIEARQGPIANPPQLQVGDLAITVLDGGHLWLDGGAMFGIIPKPIWSRQVKVDAENRIPLAMTAFLVDAGGKRILIESGSGARSKFIDKEQGFFRLDESWLLDSLAAASIDPVSIDIVILTHLHFDHGGGATVANGRGGFEPTFPRAMYIVQRGEWDDAVEGHSVMTGTYREENLAPLEAAGVLSFAKGDAEIVPGISVRVLPGHTRHQQGVVFESGDDWAILPADLMPTSAHAGLRYNMAYDLLPYENMQNKGALYDELTSRDGRLLLGQDPNHVVWRVTRDERDRRTLTPSD